MNFLSEEFQCHGCCLVGPELKRTCTMSYIVCSRIFLRNDFLKDFPFLHTKCYCLLIMHNKKGRLNSVVTSALVSHDENSGSSPGGGAPVSHFSILKIATWLIL